MSVRLKNRKKRMVQVRKTSDSLYRELSIGRTARFDAKLVHLLRCAARAFAEHGYEKTSIRQVAQDAGMSLAGVYYYVSCKEELLFLIQYHTFGVLVENMENVVRDSDSPEGRLRAMVSSHVRYLVEHLPELKVCTTELDSLGGEYYRQVLSRRQRYFELTRGILMEMSERGGWSAIHPNLATLYLFGMLNWIVMWFDPKRNDPEELSKSLATLFLDGYRGAKDGSSEGGGTKE